MPSLLEPVTESLLNDLTRTIVGGANPSRIILFGSRARRFRAGFRRRPPGYRGPAVWCGAQQAGRSGPDPSAARQVPVPIDLLLYSVDEVAKWRENNNHVVARALGEGRVLHERA